MICFIFTLFFKYWFLEQEDIVIYAKHLYKQVVICKYVPIKHIIKNIYTLYSVMLFCLKVWAFVDDVILFYSIHYFAFKNAIIAYKYAFMYRHSKTPIISSWIRCPLKKYNYRRNAQIIRGFFKWISDYNTLLEEK